MESSGGRFTEDVAVSHRKAPKFEEMIVAGDLRDTRGGGIGASQGGPRAVQAFQQSVTYRAYAEKFGATHSERSLCHTELSA